MLTREQIELVKDTAWMLPKDAQEALSALVEHAEKTMWRPIEEYRPDLAICTQSDESIIITTDSGIVCEAQAHANGCLYPSRKGIGPFRYLHGKWQEYNFGNATHWIPMPTQAAAAQARGA